MDIERAEAFLKPRDKEVIAHITETLDNEVTLEEALESAVKEQRMTPEEAEECLAAYRRAFNTL